MNLIKSSSTEYPRRLASGNFLQIITANRKRSEKNSQIIINLKCLIIDHNSFENGDSSNASFNNNYI